MRGLREVVVENFDDCLDLLRLGEFNRHYAQTKMNHQSSRSHTLFRLHVESLQKVESSENSNMLTESVLVINPIPH